MNKYINILICVLAAASLTACGGQRNNEPETVVNLYNEPTIMDRYMEAVEEYDHVIYEEVYFDWGGRSIGPTEYGYRGVVYLTEEEAERLWNEYKWEEADPEFEFEKVNEDFLGDDPWYSCNDFNNDNYKTPLNIKYTVFDGKKLVFDIHQM